MEPELIVKVTVGPEKQKPEPNNEEAKQTLEKNTPDFSSLSSSSSSSSSSSGLSLEFGIDEEGDIFDESKLKSISSHSVDAPAGYDPNRIPASVFSTKPSNPEDCSVASNESLFSIHMGNNSFSRDHALLYAKSGELGRFDDWNNHGDVPDADKANYTNEPILVSGLPTVVEEGSVTSGGVYRTESLGSLSKVSDRPGNHRGKEGDQAGTEFKKRPLDGNSPNSSNNDARCSEESGKSDVSFAFPVLVGDGVKTESMRRDTDVTEKTHESQEEVSNTSSDHTNAPEGSWLSRFCCWPRSG